MAKLLLGAEVASALDARTMAAAEALIACGVTPTLAILRVGERRDDIAYARGATKRCAAVGVRVQSAVLPDSAGQQALMDEIARCNEDDSIHGVLLLRPLPKHLDGEAARRALLIEKDVDGVTDGSLAGVFTGSGEGFAPCTAQAVLELLTHYRIDCAGKRAVVIGRSLVVGKPVAMLLLNRNATVAVCHTRTVDLPGIARQAEILVVCAGAMEKIDASCLSPGQTVVDVGIHWNEQKGRLCGDVRFDEAEPVVGAITPVPGGVGTVTTSVLASHVVMAAQRRVDCP